MNRLLKKWESNKKVHFLLSALVMVISALVQVFNIQVFMNPCNLISGGFTGISLFINRLGALTGVDLPVSLLIIILNVPAAMLCWKGVSRRFVILSVIQFSLVSLFLNVFSFEPLFYDITCNILFGGILWGASIAICLEAGGSTGGTDFIAQYIGNRTHKSIFEYVFYFNVAMYIAYGFSFGWIYCAYSIIFQFLSTTVINRMYNRYRLVTMEITCSDPDPVVAAFMNCVRHGMSVIQCTGGYSGKTYYICKAVVNAYEVGDVSDAILQANPKALINVYSSMSFKGNFYQKPIE